MAKTQTHVSHKCATTKRPLNLSPVFLAVSHSAPCFTSQLLHQTFVEPLPLLQTVGALSTPSAITRSINGEAGFLHLTRGPGVRPFAVGSASSAGFQSGRTYGARTIGLSNLDRPGSCDPMWSHWFHRIARAVSAVFAGCGSSGSTSDRSSILWMRRSFTF